MKSMKSRLAQRGICQFGKFSYVVGRISKISQHGTDYHCDARCSDSEDLTSITSVKTVHSYNY